MRFEVRHEIEYRYSKPVGLEPHTLYLKPREEPGQRLVSFECVIEPAPRLRSFIIDPFGNDALRVWFDGVTDQMIIRARSEVEITRSNPFDYVTDPPTALVPIRYSPVSDAALRSYRDGFGVISQAVSEFARDVAVRSGASIVSFLPALCVAVYAGHERIHRPDGGPWPSSKVLAEKRGSCRDLTMLFMDCCRAKGLAARFTSGYFEGDPDFPEKDLHAWAEVYVEGGGWRGFDPTHGLAVAEHHVAIASAALPEAVSPVIGSYRGDARSQMRTRVENTRKDLFPAL